MDGNGRWAKARNLPRTAGHHQGISRIREVVKAASNMGIKYLTLFAFSTENWDRPKREVNMLMRYLDNFLTRELKDLDKNNIRLRIIGRAQPIPEFLLKKIKLAQEHTSGNTGMTLVIALNYGSRQEIVDAVKKFVLEFNEGRRDLQSFDEEMFSGFLYTSDIPDPDLLIRTSGEIRVSNFLLWQISYAELCFVDKHWPDFNERDLESAIEDYQKRERRFGRI